MFLATFAVWRETFPSSGGVFEIGSSHWFIGGQSMNGYVAYLRKRKENDAD
jgi:hypothetical protein